MTNWQETQKQVATGVTDGSRKTPQTEALKLALEMVQNKMYAHAEMYLKEALAQPDPYAKGYADAMNWKVQNHLEHLPAAQPEQEPVEKPYAYEYGQDNGDGTYSVVIEKGDLVQTSPTVYNYVRPRNPHKDWPVKELFDHTPPQRTWVGLTKEDMDWLHANTPCIEGNYGYRFIKHIEAKLKEKNT